MNSILNLNRLYKRYFITDSIYIENSELKLLANVKSFNYVDNINYNPKSLYSKRQVLEFIGEKVCAKAKKSFEICFNNFLNVETKDVFSFGFNSVGDCNYLNVKFISSKNKIFESLITVNNERWNTVNIDITSCDFLSDINKIQFEFYGRNDLYLISSIFDFSDIKFGNICDFTFKKGNFIKYFSSFPTSKNLTTSKNGLKFKFDNKDELIFPFLEEPLYTEASALLNVKDTLRIVLINKSKCNTFSLYFSTDKEKEFNEKKCIDFIAITCEQPISYQIYLKKFVFSCDERLYGIKIVPKYEKGEIEICEVSFEQEEVVIDDKNAKSFNLKKAKNIKNPYKFKINNIYSSVLEFGAKGDGYTDDTANIQKAIDFVCESGGGKVVLSANRRYIATHLQLKSDVEFVIEKGAILLQSSRQEDYTYDVLYEHDNIYKTINWAHNFLVNNKPLLYVSDSKNVKISGGGIIRLMDSGCDTLAVGFPFWPSHCGGIIHIAPIGINNCYNIDIQDITIIRASAYHIFVVKSQNVFINKIKLFEVRCLSADGIGLSDSKNVLIANSIILTNDDGVTLCSMYNDPRANGWWQASPDEDNCVSNIEVNNCYINSAYGGGGKAISFIPWGTDAKDVSKQEIKDIYIHNCILNGGHSVGAWADNPYNGKQPFDNTEIDDYSPVKNIKIIHNKYLSKVSLECIKGTNIITDCGLISSNNIVNGDFKLGKSNWNFIGENQIENGCVVLKKSSKISQGITLQEGINNIIFKVEGSGIAYITGKKINKKVKFNRVKEVSISICLKLDSYVKICVKSRKNNTKIYLIKRC